MSSQRRVLEASAAAHQRGEPATLVVVAALVDPDLLVEVEVDAIVPDGAARGGAAE